MIGVTVAVAASCKRANNRSRRVPSGTVNASFFELYSVRHTADQTHMIAITARDGSVWHRETLPILDLSHCHFENALLEQAPDGRYSVCFRVKKSYRTRLERWTQTHIGEHVGLALEGEFLLVLPLEARLSNKVCITAFATETEAQTIRAQIQAGGIREKPVEQETSKP